MIDGQIHDVVSVAKMIQEMKEPLEEKHGPLHRVSVATAGRALKTFKASAFLPFQDATPIRVKEVIKQIGMQSTSSINVMFNDEPIQ